MLKLKRAVKTRTRVRLYLRKKFASRCPHSHETRHHVYLLHMFACLFPQADTRRNGTYKAVVLEYNGRFSILDMLSRKNGQHWG